MRGIHQSVVVFSFVAWAAHADVPSRRVLLSGFEPFGGRRENSSQVAVETLAAQLRANPDSGIPAEVDTVIVPVVYDVAPRQLLQKMDSFHPDIVISVGEAPDAEYRLERRARNKDDSPFPDSAGVARMGETIVQGAPEYLRTGLPVDQFYRDLTGAGLTSVLSNSAGSYLCNHIFYHLMYAVSAEAALNGITAGFIHVPADSSENNPSYPARHAQALRVMLRRLFMPKTNQQEQSPEQQESDAP